MREIPDYIIENQIGEGSHGTVWLGRKKENNQIVCIKIAKPGFESALRHEFQILRSIKHQNIICPEVIFDENEKVCMVMPYYPDLTVERLLVGHNSEPQNLIIANVLYKSNVLESWGRGIALMVNECNRVGIPAPEFNTNGTAVWVTFRYTRTTVGPKHHPSTTQAPPKHHPSRGDAKYYR